jgi:hypothetical protein
VRQNGPGERRHVGDRAARGIGLIFTHDPEVLLAAVVPAQGDGHAEGRLAFVSRGVDDLRARAPRPPVTDLPQSGCGSFPVAFVCCGTVPPPRNGRERPRWPQALLRSRNCGEAISASGSSAVSFSAPLTNARLIAGYRCCTGLRFDLSASIRFDASALVRSGWKLSSSSHPSEIEVRAPRSGHRVVPGRLLLRVGIRRGIDLRIGFAAACGAPHSCLSSHNSKAVPHCSRNKRPSRRRVPATCRMPSARILSRFACALHSSMESHFFLHSFWPRRCGLAPFAAGRTACGRIDSVSHATGRSRAKGAHVGTRC